MTDPWFDFLAGRIELADPDEKRCGIRGLDRLIAVEELRHYADETLEIWPEWAEGDITMAKGPKAPPPKGKADTGKTGKHHGGNLHGDAKTESTGKHAKGGKK